MIKPQRYGVVEKGLRDLISELPYGLIMAEIGCYAGESTSLFLHSGRVTELHAVDIWRPVVADAEVKFNELLSDNRLTKYKMTFAQALPLLPKLDFVYIDADHSYKAVYNDIQCALKIVKKGGIIAGHDYSPKYSERVVKAVHELLGVPQTFIDTSWLIRLK